MIVPIILALLITLLPLAATGWKKQLRADLEKMADNLAENLRAQTHGDPNAPILLRTFKSNTCLPAPLRGSGH